MNTISESATPWRAATELAIAPSVQPETGSPPPGELDDDGFQPWGGDGFSFLDFIDIINPLHHIPVIGTLYRQLSGDEIDAGSRVLGGTLFFGPVGTVASIANVLVEEGTGMDVGEHVIAFFDDQEPGPPRVSGPGGEAIADVGVRSGPLPAPPSGPAAGAVDPVTAWAMSEVAYRKTAADKAHWAPVGDTAAVTLDAGPDGPPARDTAPETAAAANPVSVWAALTAVEPAQPTTAAMKTGTNQAAGAVRDARAGASLYQAAAADMDRRPSAARKANTGKDTGAAPGAIGQGGGWFTETMLTALERYDDGAALTSAAAGASLAGKPGRPGLDITR